MIFVDTNYFVRYLLNDMPKQAFQVHELFKKASDGKLKLFSSTIVFFETYWVFLRYYGKSKKETLEILKKVLHFKFVVFSEREILKQSLAVYEKTTLELEDCYNIAYAKEYGMKEFKTFDRKLTNYLKK